MAVTPMSGPPPTSTSLLVNLTALATFASMILFCRSGVIDTTDAVRALLLCLGAAVAPMVLLDLVLLRVHRRPTTGLAFAGRHPLHPRRVAVKLLGLVATLACCALAYWTLPEYRGGFYAPFFHALRLVWPLVLALVLPYLALVDAFQVEPEDEYYQLGSLLLGRRAAVRPGALGRHALAWLVKAYFLPVMFMMGLQSFLHQLGASHEVTCFRQAFDLLHDGLFTVDLLYAMVGYALTSRLIDAQIRSSEPTLLGWAVTLVCYTPFWGMLRPAYFDYDDADAWGTLLGGHPMLYTVWGSVILALLAVYVLSTIYFGTRFSNLTYRGLLSSGPYRLCKHPAYVCKNLSWWLIAVPVVSSQGWQAAVRNSLRLLLVNLIYFARARTEERHLGRYPEYADERARRARLARSPGPGAALQAAWRELISWS